MVQPAQHHSNTVETLLTMGFTHAMCSKAVQHCGEDVTTACEFIMAHLDDPHEFWTTSGINDSVNGSSPGPQQSPQQPQQYPPPAAGTPPVAVTVTATEAANGLLGMAEAAAAEVDQEAEELERALAMSMEADHGSVTAGAAVGAAAGEGVSASQVDDETARAIQMSLGDDSSASAGAAAADEAPLRPTDDEIRAHYETVVGATAENIKSKPLVGPLEDMGELKKEYADGLPVFSAKIDTLAQRYSHVRRARNDGNCFFRGFAFALFEWILVRATSPEIEQTHALVAACKPKLLAAGFHEVAFGDMLTVFQDQLRDAGERTMDVKSLVDRMNETPTAAHDLGGQISDWIVMFLRLLTSAELERRKDFFFPFVAEEAIDMYSYRTQRVDPMGEEADQLHIIALVDAIGIAVRVEYLDGTGAGETVNHHDFVPTEEQQQWSQSGQEPQLCLLYRPGHYDILYPNEREVDRQRRATRAIARLDTAI
jgi:ubiquitin thioesterase protein OTUB1